MSNIDHAVESPAPAFISRQVRKSKLFFLDLQPALADRLTVVCGGFEACSQDYVIERNDFDWLSLELVVSGKGLLTLDGRQARLQAGAFFVYGPHIPHRIESDAHQPLEKYFVDFTGSEAQELLAELGIAPGTVAESTKPGLLRNDFDVLTDYAAQRGSQMRRFCAARLTELLINAGETKVTPGSLGSRAFATYERCRRRIDSSFLELKSLDDICQLCHLDEAYLCRLFSRFGEDTPHQYLLRLKISHAAGLLLDGDPPVKWVAEKVGFSDPFHFSKVFKRFHGVPPAHFALRRRTTA